ncbi:MAG TPA: histidine phosphatase family protein [Vicinamibacterales bacterium]|nr:histidine phosphatase family protein [Vicinamibacterales bacterium]
MNRFALTLIGTALVLCAVPNAAPDETLRLYLARHGQTDWNLARKMQGSADIPLNATGREQAATLAQLFAGERLDAVYSSQLKRSRETAEIVHGSSPITELAGLNERRLGMFEGTVSGPDYERRARDPDDALDGGETLTQFFARVQTTLENILMGHRSGNILIVGHGGTNRMIVRALFGQSDDQSTFRQENDDVYLCEIVAHRPKRFWKLVNPPR